MPRGGPAGDPGTVPVASVVVPAGTPTGAVLSYDGTQLTPYIPSKYGDGSDGASVVSGPVTLARDVYYTDLTPVAGAALNANQNNIHGTGTLDLSSAPAGAISALHVDGNNAAVNVGGTVPSSFSGVACASSPNSAAAGSAGATAAGATPASFNATTVTYLGGTSSTHNGTAGTGLAGVNAGGGQATTTILAQPSIPRHGELLGPQGGGMAGCAGGSGGGDGTATASGAGGGPGLGGYVLEVYFRRILRSAANLAVGVLRALGGKGGKGGSPSAGNRGAGLGATGAGGGCIRTVCEELAGTTHVNCCDVTGGDGGDNGTPTGTGTAGTAPGAGFGGRVIRWCRTAATLCVVTDLTAVGNDAGSGATGGIATAARANL